MGMQLRGRCCCCCSQERSSTSRGRGFHPDFVLSVIASLVIIRKIGLRGNIIRTILYCIVTVAHNNTNTHVSSSYTDDLRFIGLDFYPPRQRSIFIAERGGCFQRSLFVSLSVCLFVSTITSERLNVGW